MRVTIWRGVLWLALAASLIGCSAFRDRGFDYLQATPGKPLAYPSDMTPIPSRELYPVPDLRPVVADDKPDALAATEKSPKKTKKAKQKKIEIPEPPQLVQAETVSDAQAAKPAAALTASQVVYTHDGNGYPVLMLDTSFDWAWQWVGDALQKQSKVKVDDVDRGLAVYYVLLDGKGNSAGDPWQLKLNYTANGVQLALQVDEQAMAPIDLAEPLMKRLQEGLQP